MPSAPNGASVVATTFNLPRSCLAFTQAAFTMLILSGGKLVTSIVTLALVVRPVLGLVALAVNTICVGPQGAVKVTALGWLGGVVKGSCDGVPPDCVQLIAIGKPEASVAEAASNTEDAEFTVSDADGKSVITGGAACAVTAAAPTTGAPEHNVAAKAGVGIGGAQGAGSS